jgi:hypothetical protein
MPIGGKIAARTTVSISPIVLPLDRDVSALAAEWRTRT